MYRENFSLIQPPRISKNAVMIIRITKVMLTVIVVVIAVYKMIMMMTKVTMTGIVVVIAAV